MDYRVEKVSHQLQPLVTREVKWLTWKRVLAAAVLGLALLEGGTYAFNWSWTGFKDNDTLWDWLQLLLLPLVLAVVPIWFAAEQEQQRIWLAQLRRVLAGTVVVFAVLFVGTYAFNWSWTGFNANHKLWDWLSVLLMPMIVAVLPLWFSIRHSHGGDQTGQQHQQQASPPVGPHPS
jgi:hypothetical protein